LKKLKKPFEFYHKLPTSPQTPLRPHPKSLSNLTPNPSPEREGLKTPFAFRKGVGGKVDKGLGERSINGWGKGLKKSKVFCHLY